MAASGGGTGRSAVVGRVVQIALENLIWQDERPDIAEPAATVVIPNRLTRGTGADAAGEVTAVAPLPEAEARCAASDAYWIDPGKKAIATYAHLPLHRPGGTAGEGNRGGAVVLGAAVGLGRCRGREITADISGVKLVRVQAQTGGA